VVQSELLVFVVERENGYFLLESRTSFIFSSIKSNGLKKKNGQLSRSVVRSVHTIVKTIDSGANPPRHVVGLGLQLFSPSLPRHRRGRCVKIRRRAHAAFTVGFWYAVTCWPMHGLFVPRTKFARILRHKSRDDNSNRRRDFAFTQRTLLQIMNTQPVSPVYSGQTTFITLYR